MTSEPTTGEIVSALRNCPNCDDCLRKDQKCYRNDHDAADRLESQERTIAELKYQLELLSLGIPVQMKEITDRAESAERERDAAIEVITIQAKRLKESHVVLCNICEFEDMIGCVHKSHCDGYQLFKWRGLQPQDGEGV